MANIKDFIKKIGNSAVSLEEQQQALAQVEQTIIEAKQKRTEAVGKNADMVIQALKTIEAKLEAKLTELNNTPAKQGVQGPTGKAGKDGKNGQDGRDGVSGKDGTDGKDGVDGQDGVSVVDAKIDFDGSLVVYLSNGNEIDCGQILSPDVAQNIIINSGGSGTSQTVTDTLASLQTQINTLTGIDGVLGDMAQQNATAVAITGGTINGTTIGATTPSSVNATTITGQTGVLRGTGQNFLLQSGWAGGTSGTVGSGAVAPTSWSFGSTGGTVTYASALSGSGNSIRFAATAARPFIQQAVSFVAGLTYSISFNVETVTSGSVTLANFSVLNGTTQNTTYFVDGTSVAGTTALTAGTKVQYVHNILTVTGSTFLRIGIGVNNTATGDVTISNPQVEVGSTLNTYIPTTTTAVYGTPTLSFSGVSTIGLESNGSLFVQPAGTGALQAQATTSSTVGGNARGANAVDWQTTRGSAANVASGSQSVVGGGINNTSSNFYSSVLGGANNIASGNASFVGGGNTNTAGARDWSTVVGGYSNTAAGFYNFIGGGFTNSGTASAAVTTQSGTMNATTAVTLSGSNANIKVGQYISGTSIANDTYVAAISGTSLTLSKVASGSSTSTLSFFTPHGVVVGGGNNQATGSYSFIGGGGDAGSSANRNVASGDWSVVAGGFKNTATNLYDTVAGGFTNAASGSYCFIGGGQNQTVSGSNASVLGGRNNNCNAGYGSIVAGLGAFSKGICGVAQSGANYFSVVGDAQSATYVLSITTTNATATALTTNQSAASTLNQVILPNNQAYAFTGVIVARNTSTNDVSAWEVKGAIKRGAGVGTTALVGTPTVTSIGVDAGAATWVLAITADTTNGGISIKGTGVAATTIRWVAQITTAEVG